MRPLSLRLALHLLLAASVGICMTNAEEHTSAASSSSLLSSASETSPPLPPAVINPLSPESPPLPVNLQAWSPVIDVNDRTIQQVARFAVVAYFFNTGTKLEFVNVVSGQTQPYNGGDNYRLVITVAGPGPKTARYSVSVWGIVGTTTWQLWSFAPN